MEHTKTRFGMRQLTSFLLVLAMLITLFPGVPHAHAAETDGYTYTLKFRQSKPDPGVDAFDGDHIDVPKGEDNYSGGRKLLITATVLDAAGTKTKDTNAWVGLFRGKHTKQTDFAEEELMFSYDIKGKTSGGSAHNGLDMPIGNKNLDLYADDYTIVLFQDETDDVPLHLITFSIYWDNITETITKEATCTEDGQKHQVYVGAYKDKNNNTTQWEYDVPIEALGHDYTWTHVEGTATHTGVCSRDAGHVLTEDCTYGEDGLCTACGAQEDKPVETKALVITDKNGNETTTFTLGDPIYVTATSDVAGDWVGLYAEGYSDKSAYWYYVNQEGCVNGQTYNIFGYPNAGWEGYHVGVGTHEIRLVESGVSQTITITAPESTQTALEVEKDTITAGEVLKVKSTTYTDLAWVGVYAGEYDTATDFSGMSNVGWYYACGHNGIYKEMAMFTAGKYTVVLFADGGYTVDKVVNVTVEEPEEELPAILATDKTEYKFGESIVVTVNTDAYSSTGKDWVGLYKKGEKYDPDNGGVKSIYWYYISELGGTVDINWRTNPSVRNENSRDGEFVAGEYTIALLANDGYGAVTTVDITITKEETSRVVTDPTCEEAGTITITYSDGTTETIPGEAATGHAYGDWACNNDEKSHSKVCSNDETHVITENCTWDDGVVTTEPTTEASGIKTYTCSVCGGTKEEILPALTVEETGREVVPATCTEDGYTLVTYSDGSTQKIDIVPALGHDWGDWTHVEKTRTHTHACQRENCEVTETEDCVLEYEGVRGDQLECNCRTCGDYFEDLFWTDKEEYASGEDIIVTVNPNYAFGGTDWIGLYKAGEAPSATGITSIRWDYVKKFEGGMNIFLTNWHDRPTEDVDNILTAGEYWLYLCKNDGYEIVTHISFTVTAEEVSRETTPPTCEKDGYVTAYYSDGTSKVVVTAEEDPSLKATGHTWGDWVYDGEEKQTHTHTCTVCEEATETAACEWDEGVVTKEATETEDGLMTFTCTVCGGTKTRVISTKTVDRTETVEATCEESGYIRTWYTDGTYIDERIPAKGHAYGGWAYDSETRSHVKTCANDASHVITEECHFEVTVSGNNATYTCTVCGGSYASGVLNTNKTTYALGEEILVTVLADVGPDAWVGLYGRGESANPNAGGKVSYYWCYTSSLVGTPFNLLESKNYNIDRGENLGNGEYTLRLFADGGYNNIVAEVDITIHTDISGNTYRLKVNGEFVEDGAQLEFLSGEEVIVIPVVEGNVGYGWMGVYTSKYGRDFEFTPDTPSAWWAYFTDINNQTISLNTAVDFGVGDYTVVLFADGGYDNAQFAANFRVRKSVVSYELLREPTCTIPGSAKILYEGEEDYVFEPIDPLGHDFEDGICTRCGEEDPDYTEPSDPSEPVDPSEPIDPSEPVEPEDGELVRLAGANRIATSLLTADQLKAELGVEKFDAVVLASGLNFPDALSGSYLAAVKKAPILLTAPGFEAEVNAYITENLAENGTVYVLGGEAAVPAALLEGLNGVQRVAGGNRFETNLEILKAAGVSGNEVLVCTAMNFPDSLSAAAVGKPILLVGDKLTAEQEAYLGLLGDKNYYIIGGTGAVSTAVETALQSFGGTMRIAGSNRYETSVKIADTFFAVTDAVVLAYGRNYPDGLCGGALAAAMNAPVILVEDAFIEDAAAWIQSYAGNTGCILGGTGLLSDDSVRTIWNLAEDTEIPVIQ